MFQPMQKVIFVAPEGYEDYYPFKTGECVLFLGEIPNMPGHCAVVQWKTWLTFWGYHIEDFREPTEDEL